MFLKINELNGTFREKQSSKLRWNGNCCHALGRDLFPPIIPPCEEESDAKEDGIVFYRCHGIHAGGGVGGVGPLRDGDPGHQRPGPEKVHRLPQEQRGARLPDLLPPAGAGSVGGDVVASQTDPRPFHHQGREGGAPPLLLRQAGAGPRRGGAVRLHPRETGHQGEGRQPVDRRRLRPVPQLREDRPPAPHPGRVAEARQHALGDPPDVALPAPGRHRLGRHAGRLREGTAETVPAGDSGVEAVERVAPEGGRGEVGRLPGTRPGKGRTAARSR